MMGVGPRGRARTSYISTKVGPRRVIKPLWASHMPEYLKWPNIGHRGSTCHLDDSNMDVYMEQ